MHGAFEDLRTVSENEAGQRAVTCLSGLAISNFLLQTSWWFFTPTHLKKMRKSSKWVNIFPNFRGENEKYVRNHLVIKQINQGKRNKQASERARHHHFVPAFRASSKNLIGRWSYKRRFRTSDLCQMSVICNGQHFDGSQTEVTTMSDMPWWHGPSCAVLPATVGRLVWSFAFLPLDLPPRPRQPP